jgi:hypothetical protein
VVRCASQVVLNRREAGAATSSRGQMAGMTGKAGISVHSLAADPPHPWSTAQRPSSVPGPPTSPPAACAVVGRGRSGGPLHSLFLTSCVLAWEVRSRGHPLQAPLERPWRMTLGTR